MVWSLCHLVTQRPHHLDRLARRSCRGWGTVLPCASPKCSLREGHGKPMATACADGISSDGRRRAPYPNHQPSRHRAVHRDLRRSQPDPLRRRARAEQSFRRHRRPGWCDLRAPERARGRAAPRAGERLPRGVLEVPGPRQAGRRDHSGGHRHCRAGRQADHHPAYDRDEPGRRRRARRHRSRLAGPGRGSPRNPAGRPREGRLPSVLSTSSGAAEPAHTQEES